MMRNLKHLYIIKVFLWLNRQRCNGNAKQFTAAVLLNI